MAFRCRQIKSLKCVGQLVRHGRTYRGGFYRRVVCPVLLVILDQERASRGVVRHARVRAGVVSVLRSTSRVIGTGRRDLGRDRGGIIVHQRCGLEHRERESEEPSRLRIALIEGGEG